MSSAALTAVVTLVVAFSTLPVGILTYRLARRKDAVVEQAGIATTQQSSIGQVVDGLNTLVANLQEDNRVLREHVLELNVKLDRIIQECQDLKRQVALLSA